MFISDTERAIAILMKFLIPRVCEESTVRLLATFGGYLEFLRKMQRHLLLSHCDICMVYWRVYTKILLPPLLAAILNFCAVFISEMEQVRVILTKLLSHRDICIVYWRVYTKILLPLHKM